VNTITVFKGKHKGWFITAQSKLAVINHFTEKKFPDRVIDSIASWLNRPLMIPALENNDIVSGSEKSIKFSYEAVKHRDAVVQYASSIVRDGIKVVHCSNITLGITPGTMYYDREQLQKNSKTASISSTEHYIAFALLNAVQPSITLYYFYNQTLRPRSTVLN